MDTTAGQVTLHPYPVWVGASIAILLVSGGLSTLAVALSRAFGRLGLVLLAVVIAGLFAWIFLSDPAPPSDPIRRFSGWAALGTCILAFAIVPAAVLWLKGRERTSARFWHEVGFTFLAIVATLVAIGVLSGAAGIVVHFLRA